MIAKLKKYSLRTSPIVLLLVLAASGCGGSGSATHATEVHPAAVPGPSAEVTRSGNNGIELRFPVVGTEGAFASIPVGEGMLVRSENWTNDSGLVHLSIVHDGLLQVGACATPGNQGRDVRVEIELAPGGSRRASTAPVGEINKLIDLHANGLGNGSYELSWTEVNRGDYDFNGEANISDLVGIARFLEVGYDTSDPDAPLLTEYWVDGNQDGLVTIADITVIGQNFGSQIAGYAVRLNGSILDPDEDGFTLTRAESTVRSGLPNLYLTEYEGTINDNIDVVPQDIMLVEGISTEPVSASQFTFNMNIDMQLAETEFYDLDGSGNSGPFGPGRFAVAMLDIDLLEPLRRILPGEIPSSAEIGSTLLSGHQADVYDLMLNRPVAVALAYLPTRNLSTQLLNDPPDGSPISSFWDLEPEISVYLLPTGAQTSNQTISVNLEISKVNELKVIGTSTFTGIPGLLGSPLVQDYGDRRLSRNTEDQGTDYPGSYQNDVYMADGIEDQASWGITYNLLQRRYLETRALGFNKADFAMNAKIDLESTINTTDGVIFVNIFSMTLDGVPVPEIDLPVNPVLVKFTEISEFKMATLTPGVFINIPPGELNTGQQIFVEGRLHREGTIEGEDIYWIDELTVPLL